MTDERETDRADIIAHNQQAQALLEACQHLNGVIEAGATSPMPMLGARTKVAIGRGELQTLIRAVADDIMGVVDEFSPHRPTAMEVLRLIRRMTHLANTLLEQEQRDLETITAHVENARRELAGPNAAKGH